jgi:hypothetical protein
MPALGQKQTCAVHTASPLSANSGHTPHLAEEAGLSDPRMKIEIEVTAKRNS